MLQVVREALTNVEHHAHAKHAWITLPRSAGNLIEARVEDDGVGIAAQGSRHRHFCFAIMQDRALSVGGRLDIEGRAGGGTRVRLGFVAQTAFSGMSPAAQQTETVSE